MMSQAAVVVELADGDKVLAVQEHAAEPNTSAAAGGQQQQNARQSAVLVRKPRARRFMRTLCCCWSGKNRHRGSADQNSSNSARPPGNYALPQLNAASGNNGQAKAAGNANGLAAAATAGAPPAGAYAPKAHEKLLLGPLRPGDAAKKCLIVDLDETLVHSSFKPVKNPDFVIPVEIDGVIHQVYVLKRPGVDEFLQRIGSMYECILFTASLAKYADPVADLLDKWSVFRARLFREACVFHKGNYVKDLTRLGRDIRRVIIIDNSPASYAFHPENAIAVMSWFDDMGDTELLDIVPLLERLSVAADIYPLLRAARGDRPLSTAEATPPPAAEADHRLAGATHGEDAIFSNSSSSSANVNVIASAPRPGPSAGAPAPAAPPKYGLAAR